MGFGVRVGARVRGDGVNILECGVGVGVGVGIGVGVDVEVGTAVGSSKTAFTTDDLATAALPAVCSSAESDPGSTTAASTTADNATANANPSTFAFIYSTPIGPSPASFHGL